MVQLVRFGLDQLSEIGRCDNMQSINIGGCGNMLSAYTASASMQHADPEQLQNVEQLQEQVSESSNTRLKPRLEGKQRSIDHHHHQYKC